MVHVFVAYPSSLAVTLYIFTLVIMIFQCLALCGIQFWFNIRHLIIKSKDKLGLAAIYFKDMVLPNFGFISVYILCWYSDGTGVGTDQRRAAAYHKIVLVSVVRNGWHRD